MKRSLHNFFQMFKKDSGAHFTYNLGVWFVRVGAALFLSAAALYVRFMIEETHWSSWLSVLLISILLLFLGAKQERLAMKYPRTDVGLDKNDLVVIGKKQMDELMKEFDEAYQKVMHNREPVPTPADGKKPCEERQRPENIHGRNRL